MSRFCAVAASGPGTGGTYVVTSVSVILPSRNRVFPSGRLLVMIRPPPNGYTPYVPPPLIVRSFVPVMSRLRLIWTGVLMRFPLPATPPLVIVRLTPPSPKLSVPPPLLAFPTSVVTAPAVPPRVSAPMVMLPGSEMLVLPSRPTEMFALSVAASGTPASQLAGLVQSKVPPPVLVQLADTACAAGANDATMATPPTAAINFACLLAL